MCVCVFEKERKRKRKEKTNPLFIAPSHLLPKILILIGNLEWSVVCRVRGCRQLMVSSLD